MLLYVEIIGLYGDGVICIISRYSVEARNVATVGNCCCCLTTLVDSLIVAVGLEIIIYCFSVRITY